MYAGSADQVTVRRVLNMTAEIPHGGLSFASRAARLKYSTEEYFRDRAFVIFPPGTIAMYSNTNYGVAERVLETLSHKPYSEAIHDEVFAPLAMANATVGVSARAAREYTKEGVQPVVYRVPMSSLAMYLSLSDLIEYARMHLGLAHRQFLREETLRTMQTSAADVPDSPMALGIGNVKVGGRTLLLTNGRAGGMQATVAMIPEQKLAAIVLLNSSQNSADDIAFRAIDVLDPGFKAGFDALVEAYGKKVDAPFQMTADIAGEWQGTIENGRATLPLKMIFQADGDVQIRVGSQNETLLNEIGYDEGLISGIFTSDVPAAEGSAGHVHRVRISLRHDGDVLSGFVRSEIFNDHGSFSLPSYVRLTKKQ